MMRTIYILLISLCIGFTAWGSDRYAANSVLSEGKWVKVRVSETGMYKITYAELRKMGLEPEKVSVHGYGGWMLDENFSTSTNYIDDLPATAIWRGNDYIVFYARGPQKWEYAQVDGRSTFAHTNNPYSDYGYYFLTDVTGLKDMEMEPLLEIDGAIQQIKTFDDYILHENDWVSLNESGRELYGESFEISRSQSFSFTIPGIVSDQGVATMRFVSRSTSSSGTAKLNIGDESVLTCTMAAVTNNATAPYTKATASLKTGDWKGEKSQNVKVDIVYGQSGHTNSRLDYIRLHFKRELKPYGGYKSFRSINSTVSRSRFVVQGANANTLIFDVTDVLNPKLMETKLEGSELSFSIPLGYLREFMIVQTDQLKDGPEIIGEIVPQNLHALDQRDMIIIAPNAFREQAQLLAQEHIDRDGLTVEVVDPIAIYNEFSSGTPDATAYRRFMKMFYDRYTGDDAPKYLLLFGDGLYDNRGKTDAVKNIYKELEDRLLLTYQSDNSLNVNSYVTDDYFGFLEDTQSAVANASAKLCLGIGRIPVRTETEAKQVVQKLITYMNNEELDTWKNKVCFVADDGGPGDTPKYTQEDMDDAEFLADYMESDHPEFLVNRVYLDAYKKNKGGSGSYPEAKTKIERLLKNGLMLINYSGHGNTQAWADEKVITDGDIQKATYTNLPLWVTASCDFTRFDSPTTSGGEMVLLNKVSGGIALYTTTRPVFRSSNKLLNRGLMRNLFVKSNGLRLTLGQVMQQTKNALGSDSNKLCFVLIGDPAMKLNYPEQKARITAINGKSVSSSEFVQFKASEVITIEGEVLDTDGNRDTSFNGKVKSSIFDSKDSVRTLNNNGSGVYKYMDYIYPLSFPEGAVTNGTFSFTFEVPKTISYSGEQGKLNLYAFNEETGDEAQGAFLNYIVGGTVENATVDTVGPEIKALYLNDTTFVDGGKVNTTPLFVATLWDQSGINITGASVGHDITLIVDSDPSRVYTLNDYYIHESNQEGMVTFSIPELEPGMHTAEFMVWDIRSNSSRRTFTFEVVEGLKPVLSELIANPSPARETVDFRLSHNRPESQMNVTIMVYDISGKLQWKQDVQGASDLFKDYIVSWDLTNMRGARLRPGVYFYQAAISTHKSKEATKANKLIILAQ